MNSILINIKKISQIICNFRHSLPVHVLDLENGGHVVTRLLEGAEGAHDEREGVEEL